MSEVDILTLIEICYAAALDVDLWPSVLAQVAAVVGARGSALVPQDERRATDTIASGSLAEAQDEYLNAWWRDDPWARGSQEFKPFDGLLLRECDLVDPDCKRSSAFFQDFCRRYRIGDFAACFFIDRRDRCNYTLSIFRDPDQGPHTAEALDQLRILTPHVARALAVSRVLRDAREYASSVISGLDHLSFGTIVIDGLGCARDINATAEGFMGSFLRVDNERHLHALFPADQERFDHLIAAASQGSILLSPSSMLLRSTAEKAPLLVEAVPLRYGETSLLVTRTRRGGVLLLLHELFAPAQPQNEALLMQLGLSPAEARLAQLVGRGHSPRTAAAVLKIAESTARVHLRSCFSKLGITRQSELAIMVTRLDTLTSARSDAGKQQK